MSPLPEIRTRVAKHLLGDNRYFGHSALFELVGKETLTTMMALAVTGRRVTAEERDLLDDLCVIMTSADPRIWPLKLARVVASYGGTLAGYTASMLPMEGHQIGPWVAGCAAKMYVDLDRFTGTFAGDRADAVRAFIAQSKHFHGYGVPLRASDERLDALERRMRACGRDRRKYWRLHEALAEGLWEQKKLRPNITAGFAAMLLDLEFSPREASMMTLIQNSNTFAANAFEGARQQVDALRKLPDDCVEYVGKPGRVSPRAQEKLRVAMLPGEYVDA